MTTNKMTIETVFGTLNDADQKTLRDGVKEISIHLKRMDDEKLAIKDIVASVFDEIKVPKKIINRLAKVYHKQSFASVSTEDNEFQTLYSEIIEKI
jgi:hypothetical protein